MFKDLGIYDKVQKKNKKKTGKGGGLKKGVNTSVKFNKQITQCVLKSTSMSFCLNFSCKSQFPHVLLKGMVAPKLKFQIYYSP